MYVCVRGIDFPSFYDFDIGFWNLSDIMLCFICHFIRKIGGKENFNLPLKIKIIGRLGNCYLTPDSKSKPSNLVNSYISMT